MELSGSEWGGKGSTRQAWMTVPLWGKSLGQTDLMPVVMPYRPWGADEWIGVVMVGAVAAACVSGISAILLNLSRDSVTTWSLVVVVAMILLACLLSIWNRFRLWRRARNQLERARDLIASGSGTCEQYLAAVMCLCGASSDRMGSLNHRVLSEVEAKLRRRIPQTLVGDPRFLALSLEQRNGHLGRVYQRVGASRLVGTSAFIMGLIIVLGALAVAAMHLSGLTSAASSSSGNTVWWQIVGAVCGSIGIALAFVVLAAASRVWSSVRVVDGYLQIRTWVLLKRQIDLQGARWIITWAPSLSTVMNSRLGANEEELADRSIIVAWILPPDGRPVGVALEG